MLHDRFQGQWSFGSEEDFKFFLPYMGIDHIGCDQDGLNMFFIAPAPGGYKPSLVTICPVALEK